MAARVALVTGASRGIGAATARRLARDGLDVAVNFRTGEGGASAVLNDIERSGRRGLAVQADVSKAAEVFRMVGRAVRELGRLDVLVNNAGVYERRGLDGTTPGIGTGGSARTCRPVSTRRRRPSPTCAPRAEGTS